MTSPLPAHELKHLAQLRYPLTGSLTLALHQSGTSSSTGTTLWLSAQLLASHLCSQRPPKPSARPRALDLGAGVGLTSLALAHLGYDVTATDLPVVVDSVLARNVEANRHLVRGPVNAGVLDWTDLREDAQEYDVVVTADTVYKIELVAPLAEAVGRYLRRGGTAWVALERRDEEVVEKALAEIEGVLAGKGKVVKRGVGEWEGVEVWKFGKGRRGGGGGNIRPA